MRKGILFGVGIGPGDKKLITLKAQEILNKTTIIAIPRTINKNSTAYNIIKDTIDFSKKEILDTQFPMSYSKEITEKNYQKIAKKFIEILESGKNIAMPILGDISIYSTFSSIAKYVRQKNFKVEIISGIPSFIEAANIFGINLIDGIESLTILSYSDPDLKTKLNFSGTKVIMKIGSHLNELITLLNTLKLAKKTKIAVNIGMEDQKIFNNINEIQNDLGYFALAIISSSFN